MGQSRYRLSTDPDMPPIGSAVDDRYVIRRVIGEGGFAAVFEALDRRTNSTVAVKVMDPMMSRRDDLAARFRREVDTVARLKHPNTIKVSDSGTTESGCLYLVMELLEGESLDLLLEREGRLAPERVVRIALQVLKSLHEAHERGIVHRDLKPANIFLVSILGEVDYAKVLDFGIAKTLDHSGDQSLTQTGDLVCSPHYVAPERIGSHEASPATDLYSLGIVMIELLQGRTPYEADTPMAVALKHMKLNEPVPIDPGIESTPLGKVIRKAVEKRPERRFSDAMQMHKALKVLRLHSLTGPRSAVASAREPAPRPGASAPEEDRDTPMPATGASTPPVIQAASSDDVPAQGPGTPATTADVSESASSHPQTPGKKLRHVLNQPIRVTPRVLLAGLAVLVVGVLGIALSGDSGVGAEQSPEQAEGMEENQEATDDREPVPAPDGFVWIPAGTFTMGAPRAETGSDRNERQREVTLTRDLFLQAREVSQEQWEELMGTSPSYFRDCGPACPVERVNWYEALAYANALSDSEGLEACYELVGCEGELGSGEVSGAGAPAWGEGTFRCESIALTSATLPACDGYRLPTEAEWEYAARAGTTNAAYGPVDQIAWHRQNAGDGPRPVGTREPNEWLVHDMLGNVWEWVNDRYEENPDGGIDPTGPEGGDLVVQRGGGWNMDGRRIRAALRRDYRAVNRSNALGFRMARSVAVSEDAQSGHR